ncbi:MAG: hypothetical protein KFF73_14740 [Cyclobacteriaceae bacterium]|nr:hypothetical protein [Cyclobacteriaceae bacterium]
MYPINLHRRYFDLKILTILVVMILFIFSVTSTRAQETSPGHKYILMNVSGLTAVPPGDFYCESNRFIAWRFTCSPGTSAIDLLDMAPGIRPNPL